MTVNSNDNSLSVVVTSQKYVPCLWYWEFYLVVHNVCLGFCPPHYITSLVYVLQEESILVGFHMIFKNAFHVVYQSPHFFFIWLFHVPSYKWPTITYQAKVTSYSWQEIKRGSSCRIHNKTGAVTILMRTELYTPIRNRIEWQYFQDQIQLYLSRYNDACKLGRVHRINVEDRVSCQATILLWFVTEHTEIHEAVWIPPPQKVPQISGTTRCTQSLRSHGL